LEAPVLPLEKKHNEAFEALNAQLESGEIDYDQYDAAWVALDEDFAADYDLLYGTEANNYEDSLVDQLFDLQADLSVL
jgi:hypothetical protein